MNDEICVLYGQVGYYTLLVFSIIKHHFSVTSEGGFRIKYKSLFTKKDLDVATSRALIIPVLHLCETVLFYLYCNSAFHLPDVKFHDLFMTFINFINLR